MTQYRATWSIDIEADSPEDAALQALQIQRDEDSEALVFEVKWGILTQSVDLAPTDPPRPEKGAYVIDVYHIVWGNLECHFDYSKGEKGSWEGGQQMEPDDPERCDLYAAYWQGHDVYNLLDADDKSELEEAGLGRMERDADGDYEPDHYDDEFYPGMV